MDKLSRHMLGDASKNALAMQFAAEDETVDTYTVPAMSTAQSLQGLYRWRRIIGLRDKLIEAPR
jgi:hypothetical protein